MDRRLFLKRGAASLSAPAALALASPANAAECTAVEVVFSPHGGAEALVLKTIAGARRSIRLLAYSFTSPSVVRALLAAKKIGVDVAVTVDYKNNVEEDRSGKARAALSALTYAGIPVRVVSAFELQHEIFYCGWRNGSDRILQPASCLYNSENVMVLSGRVDLAQAYLSNWREVTALGEDYRAT